MGRSADVCRVADCDDIKLFISSCRRVCAALAEDVAILDVEPARGAVGIYADAHLILAGTSVDAELEVVGCECSVILEEV